MLITTHLQDRNVERYKRVAPVGAATAAAQKWNSEGIPAPYQERQQLHLPLEHHAERDHDLVRPRQPDPEGGVQPPGGGIHYCRLGSLFLADQLRDGSSLLKVHSLIRSILQQRERGLERALVFGSSRFGDCHCSNSHFRRSHFVSKAVGPSKKLGITAATAL